MTIEFRLRPSFSRIVTSVALWSLSMGAAGRSLPQASTPAPTISLAGKWDLTVTTSDGPQKGSLDLEVADDGSITGTVHSQYGDASITSGSISGNKFNLRFTLNLDGPTVVIMDGTIDGDSIEGNGAAGDSEFTFTGSRSTATP